MLCFVLVLLYYTLLVDSLPRVSVKESWRIWVKFVDIEPQQSCAYFLWWTFLPHCHLVDFHWSSIDVLWNGNIILTTYSSLFVSVVVILTTSGATNEKTVVKVTIYPPQCGDEIAEDIFNHSDLLLHRKQIPKAERIMERDKIFSVSH